MRRDDLLSSEGIGPGIGAVRKYVRKKKVRFINHAKNFKLKFNFVNRCDVTDWEALSLHFFDHPVLK